MNEIQEIRFSHQGSEQVSLYYPSENTMPVVYIHGLLNSCYFLNPALFGFFSQLGPVYSIPLPGHYPSVHRGQPLTPALALELIEANISHLLGPDQPYIVFGHSTGGLFAEQLAIKYPERVKGLITSGTTYHGVEHGKTIKLMQDAAERGWYWLHGFLIWFNGLGRLCHKLSFMEAWWSWRNLEKQMDFNAYVDWYYPAMKKIETPVVARWFAMMKPVNLEHQLESIKASTLIINGQYDPYVDHGDCEFMANRIPGAEFVKVPKSGHWPMYEQPYFFRKVFLEWSVRNGFIEPGSLQQDNLMAEVDLTAACNSRIHATPE